MGIAVYEENRGNPLWNVVRRMWSCTGRAMVVVPPRGGEGISPMAQERSATVLSLASRLAEIEASASASAAGLTVPVVVLLAERPDDAAAIEAAARWLGAHGRRVVVRTRVVLPRRAVEVLGMVGATVLLELASIDREIKAVLLGGAAASSAALLLHAQHLRARGIGVAACVGPLVPGVHDAAPGVKALWQHAAAADLHDGHITVGRLDRGRFEDLERLLPLESRSILLRSRGEPSRALRSLAEREAEDAGIAIDRCGCPLQCHLETRRRSAYVSLSTPELFTPELFKAS